MAALAIIVGLQTLPSGGVWVPPRAQPDNPLTGLERLGNDKAPVKLVGVLPIGSHGTVLHSLITQLVKRSNGRLAASIAPFNTDAAQTLGKRYRDNGPFLLLNGKRLDSIDPSAVKTAIEKALAS